MIGIFEQLQFQFLAWVAASASLVATFSRADCASVALWVCDFCASSCLANLPLPCAAFCRSCMYARSCRSAEKKLEAISQYHGRSLTSAALAAAAPGEFDLLGSEAAALPSVRPSPRLCRFAGIVDRALFDLTGAAVGFAPELLRLLLAGENIEPRRIRRNTGDWCEWEELPAKAWV